VFSLYFNADVLSYSDYYPFGQLMPNRHGSSESYRYGFQGQEKDDELKGEGNSLNYTFRIHDPRIGRFLSIDPLAGKMPEFSPYSFVFNNPMRFTDPDGREPKDDIRINTKTNETEIIRTNDKFDRVFKDGSFVGTTQKGYAENAFKQQGKSMKETSYPQGVGMGAVDGAIAFLAVEVIGAYVGIVKGAGYLSAFGSKIGKVTTDFLVDAVVNSTTQYVANGGKFGEINMLEATASGVPIIPVFGKGKVGKILGEVAPVVAGETFSYTAKNYEKNEYPQFPNSPKKWGAQVGGGILSFGFGKVTDNHLANEKGGAAVGRLFKGVVETGLTQHQT
jgi:RHS repeat-associated protein